MKTVCKQFARGDVHQLSSGTAQLIAAPLEPELISVADSFVELQEARHVADYDVWEPFGRVDVLQKIALAEQAINSWNTVRDRPNAKVFLAALLLQRQWNR